MTYQDRNQLLNSEEFQAQCRIALADWLNYWATNGTESITDETLRERTDNFISFAVHNLDRYARAISVLAVAEDVIKLDNDATDEEVSTAVTHVLSTALEYLL